MVEIWKPVPLSEFAEHYEVSSLGRVRRVSRSKTRKKPHLMRGESMRKGYIRVVLSTPGVVRRIMVHVLVATAFIGPRPAGLQVNHKDGNKANNRADNLEWVTSAENSQHRDATGLHRVLQGEEHWNAKLTADDVRAIREAVADGASCPSLAFVYGVDRGVIWCIAKRKTWKHVV